MAKRTQFGELNEWVTLLDSGLIEIESVWAKRDYHKDFQLYKDNVTFTVRNRDDVLPGCFVRCDGYDYPVVNIAHLDKNYLALECTLAADLYPPT